MWPMLMTVLAGHPVIETSNLALVPGSVGVPVPEQLASASASGGFSFALLSSALKTLDGVGTGVGATVGVGVGDGAAAGPPHAAATTKDAAMAAIRRIGIPPSVTPVYAARAPADEKAEQTPKPDPVADGHHSPADDALRL